MSTLAWIVISGLAMALIAMVGSTTLALPRAVLDRLVLPLVALAAGSLLGGALFFMIPEALAEHDTALAVLGWVAVGFTAFFVVERGLHWHHGHRAMHKTHPVGWLILLADATHNLAGGFAVAGAFLADVRTGIITWLVAAAHEVPQELGDFGVLVHSGWEPRPALAANVASALTFLGGGLLAYGLSGAVDLAWVLPFAAGTFIYIAAADLLPRVGEDVGTRATAVHVAALGLGLGGLFALAVVL